MKPKTLYLAIAGGRGFSNYEVIGHNIRIVTYRYLQLGHIHTGDAKGVDATAIAYAEQWGIPFTQHKADWTQHGKAAGPIRNKQVLKEANHLLAFWNGKSPGTKDIIDQARKLKINTTIIYH